MASTVHQFSRQLRETGAIRMFEGSGGYGAGEQRRDFVYVKDVARINLFFAGLLPESPRRHLHAVINAGTGTSRSFNDVAHALIKLHGQAAIEYIPFPDGLKERYQHYTQADIEGLRAAGYTAAFTPLEQGIREGHC